jgi:hypothetical protein
VSVRARAACVVVVAFFVGCARHEGAPTIAKDPTPGDATVDVTPAPKAARITVSASVLCMAGVCVALVETRNDGDVAIAIDDEMIAERAEDGGFVRVAEQYVTVGACDAELSKYGPHPGRPCKSLGPHETLKAESWRGFTCSSQCVWTCRANAMHPKGTYRFVVHECGGAGRTFTSDTIQWPGW